MSNVVRLNDELAQTRIKNKQTAKYVVLTMLEVIKTEQKIINDMQSVLDLYETEKQAVKEAGAEYLEEPKTKELISSFEKINTECINDAMALLNDLIGVMSKHKLMTPQGIYETRDIKKHYEDINNE